LKGRLNHMGPTLQVPIDGIFIGDFFGFVLALPLALFLVFWMSAVKNRFIVVLGALLGAVVGFVGILGWVGTLIYNTDLPGANGVSTFFGSVLICSILGLSFGMILDLIVARVNRRDYSRRSVVHE
jgi:hypothetical protein